jgi:hypothetical protein
VWESGGGEDWEACFWIGGLISIEEGGRGVEEETGGRKRVYKYSRRQTVCAGKGKRKE